MDPGIGFAGAGADLFGGIECAGVDVAGLNAEQGAVVEWRKRVGAHASLAVDGNARDAGAAEAEKRERFEQRDVDFVADHDIDGWRAEEAIFFDVPSGA